MTATTRYGAADVATADTRYGRLAYFRDDDPIGAALRMYGEWAQIEIDVLLRFIRPGDVVVDAGANVGTHTTAFAHAVGASGRVLAFEPQPPVFDLLERNVRANGYDQVTCHRAALGAERSVRGLPAVNYATRQNVGAIALLPRGDEAGSAVDVIALDDLALDTVRLIKIDVEGMECEVLRGAAHTLTRCRPLLAVECNSLEAGTAILAALHGAGYTYYLNRTPAYNAANHSGNALNRFGTAAEAAILCVPRELHDALSALCAEQPTLTPVEDAAELASAFEGRPRTVERPDPDRVRYREAKLSYQLADAERRAAEAEHRAAEAERRVAELDTAARSDADARVSQMRTALEQAELRLTESDARFAAAEWQRVSAVLQRDEADARRAESDARRAESEASRAESEARRAESEVRYAESEARRAESDARRADAEARCAESEARCAESDARREEAERAAESSEKRAVLLAAAAAEAHAAALVAEQRAVNAEQRALNAEQRAVKAETDLRERDAVISALVTSHSWRFTRPLRLFKRLFSRPSAPPPPPGGAG